MIGVNEVFPTFHMNGVEGEELVTRNSDDYSGWRVFHKDNVCDKIDDYIKLDLLNRKKIVALMFQLTNSRDLVFEPDLYKKICDNIVVKYYG